MKFHSDCWIPVRKSQLNPTNFHIHFISLISIHQYLIIMPDAFMSWAIDEQTAIIREFSWDAIDLSTELKFVTRYIKSIHSLHPFENLPWAVLSMILTQYGVVLTTHRLPTQRETTYTAMFNVTAVKISKLREFWSDSEYVIIKMILLPFQLWDF
jgi:hypothetical protein